MKGINLLKYHDKSFSDLHRLMSGEIQDPAFTELVLSDVQAKPEKKSRFIVPVFIVALIALFGASIGLSYMYFSSNRDIAKTEEPVPDVPIITEEPVAQPITRLEKEGYTRIGGVEFVDTPVDNTYILVSEYDAEGDKEVASDNLTTQAVVIKSLDVSSEPEPRMVIIPRGTYVAAGKKAGTVTPPTERQTQAPTFIPSDVQARQAEEARQAAELARVEAESQAKAKKEAEEAERIKQQEQEKQKQQQVAKSKSVEPVQKTATTPANKQQAASTPKTVGKTTPEPKKTSSIPVTPATIPGKIYSIDFENVNSAQRYSILASAERAGLKSEQEVLSTGVSYVWRVYKLVPGSPQKLDGRGVEFAADLTSKEEALEYVRKKGIPAAIQQVKIENSVYNVRVCCMENDKALSFVRNNSKNGVSYKLNAVANKSN